MASINRGTIEIFDITDHLEKISLETETDSSEAVNHLNPDIVSRISSQVLPSISHDAAIWIDSSIGLDGRCVGVSGTHQSHNIFFTHKEPGHILKLIVLPSPESNGMNLNKDVVFQNNYMDISKGLQCSKQFCSGYFDGSFPAIFSVHFGKWADRKNPHYHVTIDTDLLQINTLEVHPNVLASSPLNRKLSELIYVIDSASDDVTIPENGCKILIETVQYKRKSVITMRRASDHMWFDRYESVLMWNPYGGEPRPNNVLWEYSEYTISRPKIDTKQVYTLLPILPNKQEKCIHLGKLKSCHRLGGYISVKDGVASMVDIESEATSFILIPSNFSYTPNSTLGRQLEVKIYRDPLPLNTYYDKDVKTFQTLIGSQNTYTSLPELIYNNYNLLFHSYMPLVGFKYNQITDNNTDIVQTMIEFVKKWNIENGHYVFPCNNIFLFDNHSKWYLSEPEWNNDILGYIHMDVISYEKIYTGDKSLWLEMFKQKGNIVIIT